MDADVDSNPRIFEVGAIAIDLDGTLLDTIHDLSAALNLLLAELGYEALPNVEIRAMIGKGMAHLVRRSLARVTGVSAEAIADDEVRAALERYKAHYAALLGRGTRAFPGMREGLERLAAMRIPLAVVTNKPKRFVRPHLARAGIEAYFSLVVAGDEPPGKKPDAGVLRHVAATLGVAPDRLLMVGDSDIDVQAARAAGCPVLLVPYGYGDGAPVRALGADGIVSTLADVADRVRLAPATPQ
jgi:phosphoglycolate phosphatase